MLFRAIFEALLVLLDRSETHSHAGESSIVEQVLHGDLFGQIRKNGDAIIGTIIGEIKMAMIALR